MTIELALAGHILSAGLSCAALLMGLRLTWSLAQRVDLSAFSWRALINPGTGELPEAVAAVYFMVGGCLLEAGRLIRLSLLLPWWWAVKFDIVDRTPHIEVAQGASIVSLLLGFGFYCMIAIALTGSMRAALRYWPLPLLAITAAIAVGYVSMSMALWLAADPAAG